MKITEKNNFFEDISNLLNLARNSVKQYINNVMVNTYFEIGKRIVEMEQNGENRAEYGKQLIKELSNKLTKEFGKGFSVTNIKQMRTFYLTYGKSQTVSDVSYNFELSWSHYLFLMRIKDENEKNFYEIESKTNNWSVRELKRQFNSGLYLRLVLSKNKDEIKKLSLKGHILEKPSDAIKEPYILEFLGLEEKQDYSESELENAIIDKLEHFLLELGKGFSFVGRQKRITFDEKHFYIDLVFYNRFLKCFLLIDLKIGELQHQDIGQMQMYVNYYDREIRIDGENKTIGLILCKDKSDMVVKYTLPEDNKQIFASKYQTVLPSKKELKQLIDNKINE